MKTVLVIIRYSERAKFFYRINKALEKKDYKFIFIVDNLSNFLYLKFHGLEVYILKKVKILTKISSKIEYKNTVEYKTAIYDEKYLKSIYIYIYNILYKIYNRKPFGYIFLWNGTSIYDLPGIDFSKKYNIKTLFFEIGNIPSKIFIDRMGTNANSELYKNVCILDKFNIDNDIYNTWKKEYLAIKLNKHIVPQSKKINLKKSLFLKLMSIINLFGGVFYTHVGDGYYNLLNKIKNKIMFLKDNRLKIKYDKVNYSSMEYIFFPLQVSNDSQILIHSDISLMDAILYVIKEAKEKNLELVIKPHPAEHNKEIFREIYKLKEKHKFYFINDNTFKLIKYAKKVVTINSTVGLEAKICGKDVEILGRAFYKDFTEEDLRRYILGYLVNIDYFSDEKISEEAIKELEKRMC